MPIPAPRRAALLAALSLASAALFTPALAQAQDKKTVKVGIVVGSQEEIFKVEDVRMMDAERNLRTKVFVDQRKRHLDRRRPAAARVE